MKIIIFPNESGISVMVPTGELSVEQTALKDVPSGVKFKILDRTDLPSDDTFFNAWEYDFSTDFDGVGA